MIRPAAVVLGALLAGCSFYEWRDEPYIRPLVATGLDGAVAELRSGSSDDRSVACRALGQLGRTARERGDGREAARIAGLLMEHFAHEPSHEVRSVIVALALRDVGRDDPAVTAFLFRQLAGDDVPVAAGYTLAALRPDGTFEALYAAVQQSPFERRYELLLALWLLGDARAAPVFETELDRLDSDWPDVIHHMPKAQYRAVLEGRARSPAVSAGATGAARPASRSRTRTGNSRPASPPASTARSRSATAPAGSATGAGTRRAGR
jgi:hypothetical protein